MPTLPPLSPYRTPEVGSLLPKLWLPAAPGYTTAEGALDEDTISTPGMYLVSALNVCICSKHSRVAQALNLDVDFCALEPPEPRKSSSLFPSSDLGPQ